MYTSLSTITTVAPSLIQGNGLFTIIALKSDALLKDDDFVFTFPNGTTGMRSCITCMNDLNFTYPQSYNVGDLKNCFDAYKNNNKCNLIYYNKQGDKVIYRVTRRINKDEELTRRYGLKTWIFWLLLDIFGFNALGVLDPKRCQDSAVDNLKNLFYAAEYAGYYIISNPHVDKTLTGFRRIKETFSIQEKDKIDKIYANLESQNIDLDVINTIMFNS